MSIEIDRAHAALTQRALVAKRDWFVERISHASDHASACMNRLDSISNDDDGFVEQVQAMPDGTFTIIWWRYDD